MIDIKNKKDCCGCTACSAICPKGCIDMTTDDEGFLYPKIDLSNCIDCGLCEKVCPFINIGQAKHPEVCIAAKNCDENIRLQSSSGGIFSLLATKVLKSGGIVAGAAFDKDWSVHHILIESESELEKLMGSKYVQSRLDSIFNSIRNYLRQDRKVLFSGTPCQCAGLRNFLRKDYNNLLTVEVICHGVPSPAIWADYLRDAFYDKKISAISFRTKTNGWNNPSIKFVCESRNKSNKSSDVEADLLKDPFGQAFLRALTQRPSCYECKVRNGRSGSDITIGDFWGIENHYSAFNDDKGVSVVITNTDKGKDFISDIQFEYKTLPYQSALPRNPNLENSIKRPVYRDFFFSRFKKYGFSKAWKDLNSNTMFLRVQRRLFNLIHR